MGTAQAMPDRVDLTLQLEARAPKIGAAPEQLAGAEVQLAGLLDRAGLRAAERQTSELQLAPIHDQYARTVTGNLASHPTTVRVSDISQVGPMLGRPRSWSWPPPPRSEGSAGYPPVPPWPAAGPAGWRSKTPWLERESWRLRPGWWWAPCAA